MIFLKSTYFKAIKTIKTQLICLFFNEGLRSKKYILVTNFTFENLPYSNNKYQYFFILYI